MTSLPILLAIASVALVGALIAYSFKLERDRTEALQALAGTMGLAFQPTIDSEMAATFGELPVFTHGHSRKGKNLFSGEKDGVDLRLFDYQYTVGGGKNSHTYRQTIALFPSGGQGLPDLLLAPENIFHKIGQAFGYQDIDFESAPDFSSHYLLRGPDEMAIRGAFNIGALQYFGTHRNWHVEVKGGAVGIYKSGIRPKPEDVPTFLAEARDALRALVPA